MKLFITIPLVLSAALTLFGIYNDAEGPIWLALLCLGWGCIAIFIDRIFVPLEQQAVSQFEEPDQEDTCDSEYDLDRILGSRPAK